MFGPENAIENILDLSLILIFKFKKSKVHLYTIPDRQNWPGPCIVHDYSRLSPIASSNAMGP